MNRWMPDRNSAETLPHVLCAVGLAFVLLGGIYLRTHGVGRQLVFADEIHALNSLPGHGYWYLFTHFSITDTCIPLTLYYRALMDTVGLNEWLMRLPAVLCGCGSMLLLALFAWRHYGPAVSLLATGMLAFSPYHVYLSREARPYPIVILLLLIAVMGLFRWEESSQPSALLLSAATAALAVYFHLLAIPVVVAIAAIALRRGLRQGAPGRNAVLRGAALFAMLSAALFLPAARSLVATVSPRVAGARPGFLTVQTGTRLFLNLSRNDWIWEVLLALLGASMLIRRKNAAGGAFILLLAIQVVSISLLGPRSSDIPWVWARYVALALPFWFLLIAVGLQWLLNRTRIAILQPVLATALLAALFSIDQGLYGLHRVSNYLVHPMVMAHELEDASVMSSLPVPAFYRRLAREEGAGAILEIPLNMVFPLYDLEQRIHGRPIFSAGAGQGMWQQTFNNVAGFRFRSMLDLLHLTARSDIEYVVVHKTEGAEMRRVQQRLLAIPAAANLLYGFSGPFDPESDEGFFDTFTELQKWAQSRWCRALYEDGELAVYRYRSDSAPCNGETRH